VRIAICRSGIVVVVIVIIVFILALLLGESSGSYNKTAKT
jgi:hypothetical protein